MIVIRRGDRLDVPFLRSLLAHAYQEHVRAAEAEDEDEDVSTARYVDGWGRDGDTAVVAMKDGHSIGAGWYRLFSGEAQGFGYLDDETPEVTVVVVPTRQGEGVGGEILKALLERAALDGYARLSASVEPGSPDAELYRSAGFATHGREDLLVRSVRS